MHMGYVAMLIRIVIVSIGIFMIVQNPEPRTAPFCSGVVFILVGIYFALLSVVGPKKLMCPVFNKSECCKK